MKANVSSGDRYADWAVVILTVAALVVGWFFMNSVMNRSTPFESSGVRAALPQGWMQSQPGGNVVVQTHERSASGFESVYAIEKEPIPEDGQYSDVVSLLTLNRGQDWKAYRVLSQQTVTFGGREAYEVKYAYVEASPDLTHVDLPVVVLGVDYIFLNNGEAVIVSYRASEADYQSGLDRFHRFLESVQF